MDIRDQLSRIDQRNAEALHRRQIFEASYPVRFWLSAFSAATALLTAGGAIGAVLTDLFSGA